MEKLSFCRDYWVTIWVMGCWNGKLVTVILCTRRFPQMQLYERDERVGSMWAISIKMARRLAKPMSTTGVMRGKHKLWTETQLQLGNPSWQKTEPRTVCTCPKTTALHYCAHRCSLQLHLSIAKGCSITVAVDMAGVFVSEQQVQPFYILRHVCCDEKGVPWWVFRGRGVCVC